MQTAAAHSYTKGYVLYSFHANFIQICMSIPSRYTIIMKLIRYRIRRIQCHVLIHNLSALNLTLMYMYTHGFIVQIICNVTFNQNHYSMNHL